MCIKTSELISIIIPIYNAKEEYLREALDSVIEQTFENWEAILVDDGSTDDRIPKICDEYVKKDSRFKYMRKNNEGTLLARKTGLENSRGEFIANLDNDDTYHPQFLEKMFAKIKDGDNDFVWCNSFGVENHVFSKNKLRNCFEQTKFGGATWNKLIKRSVYTKVLFPQINLIDGEDYVQLLQVIYYSEKAEYVSENLYLWRHNSVTSASKVVADRKLVNYVDCAIEIYKLMKRFFCIKEAEKHPIFLNRFPAYFLLSPQKIKHYKMEYVENFIPAYLNALQNKKIRNLFLILACKKITLPYKIYKKIALYMR